MNNINILKSLKLTIAGLLVAVALTFSNIIPDSNYLRIILLLLINIILFIVIFYTNKKL